MKHLQFRAWVLLTFALFSITLKGAGADINYYKELINRTEVRSDYEAIRIANDIKAAPCVALPARLFSAGAAPGQLVPYHICQATTTPRARGYYGDVPREFLLLKQFSPAEDPSYPRIFALETPPSYEGNPEDSSSQPKQFRKLIPSDATKKVIDLTPPSPDKVIPDIACTTALSCFHARSRQSAEVKWPAWFDSASRTCKAYLNPSFVYLTTLYGPVEKFTCDSAEAYYMTLARGHTIADLRKVAANVFAAPVIQLPEVVLGRQGASTIPYHLCAGRMENTMGQAGRPLFLVKAISALGDAAAPALLQLKEHGLYEYNPLTSNYDFCMIDRATQGMYLSAVDATSAMVVPGVTFTTTLCTLVKTPTEAADIVWPAVISGHSIIPYASANFMRQKNYANAITWESPEAYYAYTAMNFRVTTGAQFAQLGADLAACPQVTLPAALGRSEEKRIACEITPTGYGHNPDNKEFLLIKPWAERDNDNTHARLKMRINMATQECESPTEVDTAEMRNLTLKSERAPAGAAPVYLTVTHLGRLDYYTGERSPDIDIAWPIKMLPDGTYGMPPRQGLLCTNAKGDLVLFSAMITNKHRNCMAPLLSADAAMSKIGNADYQILEGFRLSEPKKTVFVLCNDHIDTLKFITIDHGICATVAPTNRDPIILRKKPSLTKEILRLPADLPELYYKKFALPRAGAYTEQLLFPLACVGQGDRFGYTSSEKKRVIVDHDEVCDVLGNPLPQVQITVDGVPTLVPGAQAALQQIHQKLNSPLAPPTDAEEEVAEEPQKQRREKKTLLQNTVSEEDYYEEAFVGLRDALPVPAVGGTVQTIPLFVKNAPVVYLPRILLGPDTNRLVPYHLLKGTIKGGGGALVERWVLIKRYNALEDNAPAYFVMEEKFPSHLALRQSTATEVAFHKLQPYEGTWSKATSYEKRPCSLAVPQAGQSSYLLWPCIDSAVDMYTLAYSAEEQGKSSALLFTKEDEPLVFGPHQSSTNAELLVKDLSAYGRATYDANGKKCWIATCHKKSAPQKNLLLLARSESLYVGAWGEPDARSITTTDVRAFSQSADGQSWQPEEATVEDPVIITRDLKKQRQTLSRTCFTSVPLPGTPGVMLPLSYNKKQGSFQLSMLGQNNSVPMANVCGNNGAPLTPATIQKEQAKLANVTPGPAASGGWLRNINGKQIAIGSAAAGTVAAAIAAIRNYAKLSLLRKEIARLKKEQKPIPPQTLKEERERTRSHKLLGGTSAAMLGLTILLHHMGFHHAA